MSHSKGDIVRYKAVINEIQRYWNHRIHDLEMTDEPVGTRGFFDDLEDYRYDKLRYLPQLVDFSSYRGKRCSKSGAASARTSRVSPPAAPA